MFGLAFSNRSTSTYKSTIEQNMPSLFTTIQEKIEYYEEYGSIDACYDFPHLVFLSFTFCPAQRIHVKVSSSHSSV
jgi:hypothetical protein